MCGRLSLFSSPDELADRFDATVREYAPSYNVAPTDDVATIRAESPDEIDALRWGLIPRWADDPDDWTLINARAETLSEKPAFREASPCLVLADGFYEWQDRTTGSQPFRVERADGEPFAMAGLHERWEQGGTVHETATVVTTEPNELMGELHHRMPVVLPERRETEWLRDGSERLLDPRPWETFESFPVSDTVNDPSADSPALVEPTDAPTEDPQAGLDEFG